MSVPGGLSQAGIAQFLKNNNSGKKGKGKNNIPRKAVTSSEPVEISWVDSKSAFLLEGATLRPIVIKTKQQFEKYGKVFGSGLVLWEEKFPASWLDYDLGNGDFEVCHANFRIPKF